MLLPAPGAPVTPTRNARPDRSIQLAHQRGPVLARRSRRARCRARSRADRRKGSMLRERTTCEIYHGLVPSARTGTIRATMMMRLAVLALALIAATPSSARADATVFLGRNSPTTIDRSRAASPSASACWSSGSNSSTPTPRKTWRSCARRSDDLGKRLRADLRPADSSFMPPLAGACYRERLGNDEETAALIEHRRRRQDPCRRPPARACRLSGVQPEGPSTRTSTVHRIYAGLNLAF